MIDVIGQRLIRGDIDEKIKRWGCWFQTPFGVCETLVEATKLMEQTGVDPRMSIVPVCVAFSDSTHEIWSR